MLKETRISTYPVGRVTMLSSSATASQASISQPSLPVFPHSVPVTQDTLLKKDRCTKLEKPEAIKKKESITKKLQRYP